MIALKLAYRNLIGAGLRTWLNVIVLSLSFVVIIWHKGLLDGWNRQARRDMIQWEVGGGEYWHKNYDEYDPFSLSESHGKIPSEFQSQIDSGQIVPILISQATIYPQGRLQSVILKGIKPDQPVLKIPTEDLINDSDEIPAIIGTRMASNLRITKGDYVTVRWRDVNGTFDAGEFKVVGIFKTDVPAVDNGQLWIPLDRLQSMLKMHEEATLFVVDEKVNTGHSTNEWIFRNQDYMLKEMDDMIKQKTVGGSVLYIILLLLAMLAIFDTQVLSVFRRQKEIGTNIALGMTRGQVIRLFTIEGAMHGILAAIVAAIYGIPLLSMQAVHGFSMPQGTDEYGMAIAEKIFPVYSFWLVLGTTLIILITTTIVSFIPARKIAKMKPTDALRGKLQ